MIGQRFFVAEALAYRTARRAAHAAALRLAAELEEPTVDGGDIAMEVVCIEAVITRVTHRVTPGEP